ncbi:hypothetical protein SeMB42_g02386 [Synchytrium endobioticum]|uniref:Uncharacterized protein n=1 Tax=Synchytrium endobioticum TaxID=286115 RepID=A0A507DFR7_9FUNG|nr:hypothetical protein SeMB42_g02386 [Synchytrium endobioticum]
MVMSLYCGRDCRYPASERTGCLIRAAQATSPINHTNYSLDCPCHKYCHVSKWKQVLEDTTIRSSMRWPLSTVARIRPAFTRVCQQSRGCRKTPVGLQYSIIMVQIISLYIVASVIFFTSIQAAPVKKPPNVHQMISRLEYLGGFVSVKRAEQEDIDFVAGLTTDQKPLASISKAIEKKRMPFTNPSLYTLKELLMPYDTSMERSRIQLARKYHVYVFERMKFLFVKLRSCLRNMQHHNVSPLSLTAGLSSRRM